ncbi:hypothetical protein PGO14_06720 [Klebsiella aerogenes]
MTDITELAQLRAELSNPAIGTNSHLRKVALSLVETLEKGRETENTLKSRNRRLEGIIDAAEKRIAELESHKAALLKFVRDSCYVFDGYDADISDAYIDAASSSLMPKIEAEPCHHCSDGSYSGLPGGACEHCMGTGLDDPAAELESRTVTVKLPKRSVGEVMHMSGFSRDYAEGWCSGNDNAIHEMRAAGIKVEAE